MEQNYGSGASVDQKPGKVMTIAILTLISGISNIIAALIWTGLIVVGTLGIGLLCAPVTILPLVLGIFEIIYAVKLMSNPPKPVQPAKVIAILEIVAILSANIFSLVTGILALVFYNDQEVQDYFTQINAS